MSNNHVLHYGNHWLQTGETHLVNYWVTDLCAASLHTKEWCEQFKARELLAQAQEKFDDLNYRAIEIMTFDEALALVRRYRDQRLQSNWTYAFAEVYHETFADYDRNIMQINGLSCYRCGQTVKEAIKELKQTTRLKKRKKMQPSKAVILRDDG